MSLSPPGLRVILETRIYDVCVTVAELLLEVNSNENYTVLRYLRGENRATAKTAGNLLDLFAIRKTNTIKKNTKTVTHIILSSFAPQQLRLFTLRVR